MLRLDLRCDLWWLCCLVRFRFGSSLILVLVSYGFRTVLGIAWSHWTNSPPGGQANGSFFRYVASPPEALHRRVAAGSVFAQQLRGTAIFFFLHLFGKQMTKHGPVLMDLAKSLPTAGQTGSNLAPGAAEPFPLPNSRGRSAETHSRTTHWTSESTTWLVSASSTAMEPAAAASVWHGHLSWNIWNGRLLMSDRCLMLRCSYFTLGVTLPQPSRWLHCVDRQWTESLRESKKTYSKVYPQKPTLSSSRHSWSRRDVAVESKDWSKHFLIPFSCNMLATSQSKSSSFRYRSWSIWASDSVRTRRPCLRYRAACTH